MTGDTGNGNRNVKEGHGCVVCGRPYEMLVVYSPSGQLLDATVMLPPGGHRVYDTRRPMVACDRHSQQEVETALARKAARDREDAERDAKGE